MREDSRHGAVYRSGYGHDRRLLARLRAADPVQGRVALTKLDVASAFAGLARPVPSDAAVVRARVARARSSFARGMAVLKGERRRALFAVYGFCRAVDDIADATMPLPEKRRFGPTQPAAPRGQA